MSAGVLGWIFAVVAAVVFVAIFRSNKKPKQ
jgi:predicted PurR-regulated permease PerM